MQSHTHHTGTVTLHSHSRSSSSLHPLSPQSQPFSVLSVIPVSASLSLFSPQFQPVSSQSKPVSLYSQSVSSLFIPSLALSHCALTPTQTCVFFLHSWLNEWGVFLVVSWPIRHPYSNASSSEPCGLEVPMVTSCLGLGTHLMVRLPDRSRDSVTVMSSLSE